MRIVFVTPTLKTGGGNRVFVELANQLVKKHQVYIVAPHNSAERHTFMIDPDVEVKSVGKVALNNIIKLYNIFLTIFYLNKEHRRDIIICSDPLFCIFMTLIKTKQLYRFLQSDDYRIFDDGMILGKGIILSLFKRMTLCGYRKRNVKFIFNSKYVFDRFCSDSGRVDVPFFIAHPALNHEIFNDRDRLSKSPQLIISLIARKHPLKGISTFINVWHNLPIEYKKAVSQVILVSHDDLSSFDTTGMDIVVPKSDMDIAGVYRKSDIFISTSWQEGFGLPPLEAMACGCAVICSDAGGINEYAENNVNCMIYEPKSEIELKNCIIKMITDSNMRSALVNNAIKKSEKFSWENSAKQLVTIIDHNIGNHSC